MKATTRIPDLNKQSESSEDVEMKSFKPTD